MCNLDLHLHTSSRQQALFKFGGLLTQLSLFSLTGDDKVSLSEFQAIFLTCTEMTMDDVTELFNLFASHQGEMDQLESGSGLSGIDEETYFYNDDYFFSRESLVSFTGPEEVRKMWDYFQTDLNPLSRILTGRTYYTNVANFLLCITLWLWVTIFHGTKPSPSYKYQGHY